MSDFDAFWRTSCTQLSDFDEEQARWLWRRAQEAQEQRISELESAAQAVIDRWDSPSWKDLPPTRDAIERLRAALEQSDE